MTDKLQEIKEWQEKGFKSWESYEWLISEVERLQERNTKLEIRAIERGNENALLRDRMQQITRERDQYKNDYLTVCRQLAGIKKQYIQTSNKLRQQREVTQKLEEKLQKKRKGAEV